MKLVSQSERLLTGRGLDERIFKRVPVMGLADPAILPVEVLASYQAIDAMVGQLRSVEDRDIADWAANFRGVPLDQLPRMPQLEHRLSAEMAARSPMDPLYPRSPQEIAVICGARARLAAALNHDPGTFPEAVVELHQLSCPTVSGIRTSGVKSHPDKLDSYVVFPEATECRPGLVRLHAFIGDNLHRYPALTAAVAMTSICNLHPFTDGNGRLSRIVFNALLSLDGTQSPYLPLHELGRISRGGFLIAMRLAQYRDDWSELGRFLTQAFKLLPEIVADPSPRGGRQAYPAH